MNPFGRRLTAGLGTAALAAGLLAAAPAAFAGTTTGQVTCTLPLGQGIKTGPQDVTIDAPATAAPGETVTVKITLGPSPATSPIALDNVKAKPTIDLALSGGASGTVTIQGPELTISVPANQPITTPAYSGTFQIPATASGTVNLTPVKTVTSTQTPYGTFDTPCDLAGAGSAASVNVEAPQTEPTLGANPGTVEPGAATELSGVNWTAGASASASLCAADGTACNPAGISASTLSIAPTGVLSGSVTVAAGTADGSYAVKVTDGAKTASTPVTVKKKEIPAPVRTITLSQSTVRPWTLVKVTGENFTPHTLVAIAGVEGTNPTFNFGVAFTDKNGKFCSYILVTSRKTTAITAVEIDTSFELNKLALAPITVK